jgi:hypothetical protein
VLYYFQISVTWFFVLKVILIVIRLFKFLFKFLILVSVFSCILVLGGCLDLSIGEVGMEAADTDDKLENELEEDSEYQKKLQEDELEREALSLDRTALVSVL